MQGSKEENVESARQISTLSSRRAAATSKKIESTSRELLTCQNFNLKKNRRVDRMNFSLKLNLN